MIIFGIKAPHRYAAKVIATQRCRYGKQMLVSKNNDSHEKAACYFDNRRLLQSIIKGIVVLSAATDATFFHRAHLAFYNVCRACFYNA